MTPAAKGKKQEAEQRTNRNPPGQDRRSSDPEPGKPRHGKPGQREDKTPGQKHVSRLRVPVLGSAPFVRFWGRRPRAVPLNPPPFESLQGDSTSSRWSKAFLSRAPAGSSTSSRWSLRGLAEERRSSAPVKASKGEKTHLWKMTRKRRK